MENFKSSRRKVTYKGNPIRLSADFSAGTLQATREWYDIIKILKGKNLQSKTFYPARQPFRIEMEITKVIFY